MQLSQRTLDLSEYKHSIEYSTLNVDNQAFFIST